MMPPWVKTDGPSTVRHPGAKGGERRVGTCEDLGPALAAADGEGFPLLERFDLLREALDDLLHGEPFPVAHVDFAPGPVVFNLDAEAFAVSAAPA